VKRCETASGGVSKICDLSQILPIAVAAITNISIQLLQSSRRGEGNCTCPFMQNIPVWSQNVYNMGEWERWCILEGDSGKKAVEQVVLQCWEHAHKWGTIQVQSTATKDHQLEKDGHEPVYADLCRTEASSLMLRHAV